MRSLTFWGASAPLFFLLWAISLNARSDYDYRVYDFNNNHLYDFKTKEEGLFFFTLPNSKPIQIKIKCKRLQGKKERLECIVEKIDEGKNNH